MMPVSGTSAAAPRMVTVPVALLAAMHDHATSASAIDAIRDAGYAMGAPLYRQFGEWLDARGAGIPEELAHDQLLTLLPEFLAGCGWGHATMHVLNDAVVALDLTDGMEASVARHGCLISTGTLAGFFGQLSTVSIAVLEVACQSAGDPRCRFLLGSLEVLAAIHEAVSAGATIDHAVQVATV